MQKNMYPIHFSFWYIVDTAVLIACLAWVQKSTIFFSTKKRFLREKKKTLRRVMHEMSKKILQSIHQTFQFCHEKWERIEYNSVRFFAKVSNIWGVLYMDTFNLELG